VIIETYDIQGVKFEIWKDDIGIFVKRDGKVLQSFSKQPTEKDLEPFV